MFLAAPLEAQELRILPFLCRSEFRSRTRLLRRGMPAGSPGLLP